MQDFTDVLNWIQQTQDLKSFNLDSCQNCGSKCSLSELGAQQNQRESGLHYIWGASRYTCAGSARLGLTRRSTALKVPHYLATRSPESACWGFISFSLVTTWQWSDFLFKEAGFGSHKHGVFKKYPVLWLQLLSAVWRPCWPGALSWFTVCSDRFFGSVLFSWRATSTSGRESTQINYWK